MGVPIKYSSLTAEVLLQEAHAAYLAGRPDEAAYHLRELLAQDPDISAAWNNLGNLLQETRHLDEAEAAFRQAITLSPDQAVFHANFGNLLKLAGRLPEAEAAYRLAIELQPDNAEAHSHLANLLNEAGRRQEAEAAYRRSLELRPDFAEAHNNLALLLLEDKRFAKSETIFRRAIDLKPDYAEAHNNLGLVLKEMGHLKEAEAAYRRSLELRPDFAEAHNNLGLLLFEDKRFAQAETIFRRAIDLKPDFAEAHNNLGRLLTEIGRRQESEDAYRRALELNVDYAGARLNLSMLLLSQGRYAEGWPWHEARHFSDNKMRRTMQPPIALPVWQGESLTGKSLVVFREQGAGDNVQFVRYAPLLKALGAVRVTFVQPSELIPLLTTARGIDWITAEPASLTPHDYWCFSLSLPFYLGTTLETIPNELPYLWALPERVEQWRSRLPASGFKVGLVWKGNPGHKNDANRSLPHLSELAPLWEVPGISFVSLQKGQGEDEARQPPSGQPLIHLGADIGDFADTAAIIAQLDLVITIDSAAAHVAGALGKPVWLLLPGMGTDWRWLLEREDSPWYPSVMRLFRQLQQAQTWEPAIRKMAAALAERLST